MSNRREFMAAGALATAAAVLPSAVHAAGTDVIKVGVIGCGGRGTGAAKDCLTAGKDGVKLVAVGDVFEGKAKNAAATLKKQFDKTVDLGDRVYGGLDAFEKVLKSDIDLVILATPPGFRPVHLEAAVKAGKNIFCEKPVAVDVPGIKKCLSLVDTIKEKKLALVAGTQRRHQPGYIETVKRLNDGAIGDVVSGRCSWNGQGIWFNKRQKDDTDVSYQLRNWYHFLWLCGDHIVEQHVHNLDVMNWVLGGHPVKAVGFGGRTAGNQSRPSGAPNEVGHIWDHFSVEYEYANNVHVSSYCTHLSNVKTDISETVYGTKGISKVNAYKINKATVGDDAGVNAYVQEHVDLLASIRAGTPLNELQNVTESTMTAILGREACYSGMELTWDELLKAETPFATMPAGLNMDSSLNIPPVPVPGVYKPYKKNQTGKA